MPFNNPDGYRRKRAPSSRRGTGVSPALVDSIVRAVLARTGGGGRRGSTTGGRLGKGTAAAARSRTQRIGDNQGFGFDDDSEGIYGESAGMPPRIGYRR